MQIDAFLEQLIVYVLLYIERNEHIVLGFAVLHIAFQSERVREKKKKRQTEIAIQPANQKTRQAITQTIKQPDRQTASQTNVDKK